MLYLCFLPTAFIKTLSRSKLERKGFVSTYSCPSWRKVRTGTEAENVEKPCWPAHFSWLAVHPSFYTILDQDSTAHSVWSPPTSLINQENKLQTCPQTIGFSQLKFLFLVDSSSCHIERKKTPARTASQNRMFKLKVNHQKKSISLSHIWTLKNIFRSLMVKRTNNHGKQMLKIIQIIQIW